MFGKGPQKTTTTTALDPQSQAYLDYQRKAAQDAATVAGNTGPQTMSIGDQVSQFMNPYQQQVVDATNAQFDKLRTQAGVTAGQGATLAGAFGGTRQGVAQGVRQANLDQTQMGLVANLMNSGYQNAQNAAIPYFENQRLAPLQAQQAKMGMINMGMGPTSSTTTQIAPGQSWLGQLAGVATAGLGIYNAAKGGGGGGGNGGLQVGGQVPQQFTNWSPPQFNLTYQNPFTGR